MKVDWKKYPENIPQETFELFWVTYRNKVVDFIFWDKYAGTDNVDWINVIAYAEHSLPEPYEE